ncbi:MAG: ComF family protein [Acidobacteria bacterium]|nr:MAG: ComF family protein [Acidobacteriota bacterium]
MLADASNAVIRALLAPCCAACDRPLVEPLGGPVCESCWQQWPLAAPPRDGGTAVEMIRSAGVYDGSLRHMIHALKYRKRRMIAPLLASRIRESCADALEAADAVVPVPLHWVRLWDRGFNQADDIAMALGLPVWRALRRRRHGPPQASLPAHRRHGNARGSYAVARLDGLRDVADRSRLSGANLVLVDDVVTTGATLEACAEVLIAAGAARVAAVTAARAVAAPRLQPPPAPRLSLVRRRSESSPAASPASDSSRGRARAATDPARSDRGPSACARRPFPERCRAAP